MTHDFWNARYAEPGFAYGTEPNSFLVSQKQYLKPGMKALAVGDGEGRNGVWLAQQGLDVLSVDALGGRIAQGAGTGPKPRRFHTYRIGGPHGVEMARA